jgi:PAS domain S-box-containing protein
LISVLYVDDEPFLLEIAKAFLERSGRLHLDTCVSVAEARRVLETTAYDAIVSDYQMPEVDGIEFLKWVRETYGDIPFILFTGRGREEVVIQALENGADYYIQKGGDPTAQFVELADKIEKSVRERRTLEAKRDSDQRILDIINFLPDATLAIDLEGTVIAWNHAMELMTGIPARDMVGKGSYEYALPFYNERRPLLLDLVLDITLPVDRYYDVITREGRKIVSEKFVPNLYGGRGAHLWFTASPVYDSRGNLAGAIESIRDISGHKKLEQSLRASERRYHNIFESSADALVVVDSPSGRILDANREATNLYGYSRDEFRSLSLSDLVADSLEGVLDGQIGHVSVPDRYHRRKDGTLFSAEINGNVYPQKARSIAIISVRDITERKQAEEALRRSERKQADIIDFLPDATLVVDSQRRVIAWNRAMEELTGVPAEQMLGKGDREYAIPFYGNRRPMLVDLVFEPEEEVERNYYHVIQKRGDLLIAETQTARPRGKESYLWGKATPLYDDLGNLTGAIESIRDIRDRKEAEISLKENLRFIQEIIDTAKEGIVVYDRDFIYKVWNPFMETITGVPASRALGSNAFSLFPHLQEQGVDLLLRRALAGETVRSGDTPFRVPDTGMSGYVYGIYSPHYNGQGEIIGVIGIIHDISERRRTEEALRESEAKFREIFNSANDAIHLHTLREDGLPGRSIDANEVACRMLGVTKDDLLKRDPFDFTTAAFDPPIRAIGEALKTRGSALFETEYRRADGTVFPVEVNSHVAILQGQKVAISIIRDITERKNAEKALQAVNDKLTMLNSITRHDILNQLSILRAYLALARERTHDPGLLQNLEKGDHVADVIQWQIEFTRNYQDIGAQKPRWQDLRAAVDSAIHQLKPIGMEITCTVEDVEIFADPILGKVFYSLMENSLFHGEHGTRIRISASETEKGLVIVYEDNGVGIPPEEKEKLFLKGYGKHTGLGLFLSHEILSITGITIQENGEFRKGARFEITVPEGSYRFVQKERPVR